MTPEERARKLVDETLNAKTLETIGDVGEARQYIIQRIAGVIREAELDAARAGIRATQEECAKQAAASVEWRVAELEISYAHTQENYLDERKANYNLRDQYRRVHECLTLSLDEIDRLRSDIARVLVETEQGGEA